MNVHVRMAPQFKMMIESLVRGRRCHVTSLEEAELFISDDRAECVRVLTLRLRLRTAVHMELKTGEVSFPLPMDTSNRLIYLAEQKGESAVRQLARLIDDAMGLGTTTIRVRK